MSCKNLVKLVLLWGVLFFSFPQVFSSGSLFSDPWELPYCTGDECGYSQWVGFIKPIIDNAETTKTLSQYIQDVVVYLLTFISIIAVIYIIYAWFKIMIWWWSEETLKKSRATILHVIIWIVIIWLAYSIVALIIDVLSSSSTSTTP